jgi:hypothetical protein
MIHEPALPGGADYLPYRDVDQSTLVNF